MNDVIRLETGRWWLGISAVVAIALYYSAPGWQNLSLDADPLTWRRHILLFTGLFTWTLMTVNMVLALRLPWMNRVVNGLDKGYGIHKWIGVGVVIMALVHWTAFQSREWMDALGWIASSPRPDSAWTYSMALTAGLSAFLLTAALVAVALCTRIPYHMFRSMHRFFPVTYLLGAVHVMLVMPASWWSAPTAYGVSAMTAAGVYGAFIALTGSIGKRRRVRGVLTALDQSRSGILDVRLETMWPVAHAAGQFAFINFLDGEHGQHPFTMASFAYDSPRFLIKPLGDYTSCLPGLLELGQQVEIEGPYGNFTFGSKKPGQIWIAEDIGIAPFLARLEELATFGTNAKRIHFWYATQTDVESRFPLGLETLCEQAGVTLHRTIANRNQLLTPEAVRDVAGNLREYSVWLCGPTPFAHAMRHGLKKLGLPFGSFHVERFTMR